MTLDLERAWAILSPPRPDEYESFPLDLAFDGTPCRVALDATGGRHLLIPAGVETVAGDSKPAILGLAVRKLRFGGPSLAYVDVSCADPELFEEFDEVATDVMEEVETSETPARTTVATVGRWRKLFASRLVRGMSKPAKLGLFAELTMLSHLLDADASFPVERWRGPLREPHDFEAQARCIEVKALGVVADDVVIHGLHQLDTHDARPLDLVLVRVMEDSDGMSIAELVAEVKDSVSPPKVLNSRLAAAGWADDPQRPDQDRFSIREVLQIPVEAGTPRVIAASLVETALPEGVRNLTYRVELNALLPLASSAALADIAEAAVR